MNEKVLEKLAEIEKLIAEAKVILHGEGPKTCGECRFWTGHCEKGRVNVIAHSMACELAEAKP